MVVLRVLSCFTDGWIREKISQRLHLGRSESRKITNAGGSVVAQHSRGDAQRVVVILPFLYRSLRKNFIAPSNQASIFRCVCRRSVSRGIDEKISLLTLVLRELVLKREVVRFALGDGNRNRDKGRGERVHQLWTCWMDERLGSYRYESGLARTSDGALHRFD